MTSQADPRGWEKLFEDPVIAEAIVNRLERPSQRLNLKGGSYREKLQPNLPATKKLVEEKVLTKHHVADAPVVHSCEITPCTSMKSPKIAL